MDHDELDNFIAYVASYFEYAGDDRVMIYPTAQFIYPVQQHMLGVYLFKFKHRMSFLRQEA